MALYDPLTHQINDALIAPGDLVSYIPTYAEMKTKFLHICEEF